MKAGDTFRLGGIPIVVVSDAQSQSGCADCAFHGPCTSVTAQSPGPQSVDAVEDWLGGVCYPGLHYEVRK